MQVQLTQGLYPGERYSWYVLFIQAGGCKAGTFDSYPKHSDDPYSAVKSRKDGSPTKLKGGVFRPSPGPKSTPTASIVQQNVTRYDKVIL